MKKVVFKNLVNFAGKHLRRGLFSNKVPGWNPVLHQIETPVQVFSCEF